MNALVHQQDRMRWVLFWVFVSLFVVIVLGTLSALFLDIGTLSDTEREVLMYSFIVEIGAAVIALFYSVFGIRKSNDVAVSRVRLSLGEFGDVTNLVGKVASLSPSNQKGASLGDVESKVLNDQGPYLPLDLPPETYSVYITVPAGEKEFSGSFVMGTYLVDMAEEEG